MNAALGDWHVVCVRYVNNVAVAVADFDLAFYVVSPPELAGSV